MITTTLPDELRSGRVVGAGTFVCSHCGYPISVEAAEELPQCDRCGEAGFRRASIFEPATVNSPAVKRTELDRGWLEMARAGCAAPALAIAEEDAAPRLFELPLGWTRIGRSRAADLRLDDPTVSRRHALVVRTTDAALRVLDDRSLNGVFVNGERVEWSALGDGDRLAVGRYSLQVLAP